MIGQTLLLVIYVLRLLLQYLHSKRHHFKCCETLEMKGKIQFVSTHVNSYLSNIPRFWWLNNQHVLSEKLSMNGIIISKIQYSVTTFRQVTKAGENRGDCLWNMNIVQSQFAYHFISVAQLTHNVCRTFSEGFHKVKAVLTFWEHSVKAFHNASVIYMLSFFPHKTWNNQKYIKLKMVCMNWGWWAKTG